MDFERLEVWQRARQLAVGVFKELADCRDFVFRDQIGGSALSVPSNIAEGMERGSGWEKCHYLRIAMGSCAELRTQLMIGSDIGYLPATLATEWIEESRELSRMLRGLINRISG
ncbi:four helix bundle protein [Pseudomonas indica]|uniref:Four helix bundle protein n=1 Tax=Pseudomonas indica TaxID=137658 RepID=A0A1G9FFE1_9PSED|nr:four helix bundle protein [Pseudomonas indica]PAU57784.1 four helix bundle protein [Pseudomonas indica]SDK87084.1 four helix bundle protein [Pseudomonas indica]